MSIPNVSSLYKKIGHGSEGGQEFARIINLLLIAEFNERDDTFITMNDSNGDYNGVDGYIKPKRPNDYTGFQYKFFPCPFSSAHKAKIQASLKNALSKFKNLHTWIMVTPEDMLKSDLEWFIGIQQKFEFNISFGDIVEYSNLNGHSSERNSFKIEHWGHTKIIDLFLNHPHIGNHYYPEIFINDTNKTITINKVSLLKLGIDVSNCNWARIGESQHEFTQPLMKELQGGMTSDPILDCYFTNDSDKTFLLHQVEVKIINVWTEIKGIPADNLLSSMGLIEIDIDFTSGFGVKEFNDPIIFTSKKPQRFKIQLKNFTQKCPGNCCKLCVNYNFSDFSIESKELFFSF